MTTDLLDFERIAKWQLAFETSETRLADVLNDVVQIFRNVFGSIEFAMTSRTTSRQERTRGAFGRSSSTA